MRFFFFSPTKTKTKQKTIYQHKSIQKDEEDDHVKAKFDKVDFFVTRESWKDFRCVKVVSLLHECVHVPRQHRQVEHKLEPIASEQQEDSQRHLSGNLGQNPLIAVAAHVYRILIIGFQVGQGHKLNKKKKKRRTKTNT